MALKIIQTCDGCANERTIRHIGDTASHQWVEFYDNRFHLCPNCIKKALDERSRVDLHG